MPDKGAVNIAIIANCQARPMAATLERLCSRVKIGSIVITHLAEDNDQASAVEDLRRADFVFAQAVQDNYPTRFVRMSNLRNLFGERLVTWPNIFFKGQTPDLCYLTKAKGERVLGPLGEYQSRPIYEHWRAGASAAATKTSLLEGGPWAVDLGKIAETSFADLKARESNLHVTISRQIETLWRERRLFFTFNHPSQHLIDEVAARLLERVSLATDGHARDDGAEPLDRLIPALLPPVARALGLNLPVNLNTKGCHVEVGTCVRIGNQTVNYALETLIDESFKCLDAQMRPDDLPRIT